MLRRYWGLFPVFGGLILSSALLANCGGKTAKQGGDDLADDCVLEAYPLQPRERFPMATPFYLPTTAVVRDGANCPVATWTLLSKPDDSELQVGPVGLGSEDVLPRFVPDKPGRYQFVGELFGEGLSSEGLELFGSALEVNVVPLEGVPFHNYNYTPTRSLAKGDNSLFVADPIGNRIFEVDPESQTTLREIPVGAWPVALSLAPGRPGTLLVLMKAADALGFVDLESGRLTDAIPVGDEPSDIVVAPDGGVAYISLATTGEVVAVDLEARRVLGKRQVVRDPRSLVLSPDGGLLYVVSHRSGTHIRYPYTDASLDDQKDLAIVDTSTFSVARHFGDLGTTLTGLALSRDGGKLYLARLRNDTTIPLATPGNKSFLYELAVLDAKSGELIRSRQFQARADVEGDFPLVAPIGVGLEGDSVWVSFEANDLALELDAGTLEEKRRVEAPGRPRAVLTAQGKIYIHGHQGFQLTIVKAGTAETQVMTLSEEDPRGEILARGQRYFTGAGQTFAKGWSCNSCHVEGMTDTVIWNAGPVKDTHVSKPFFWLEGTAPLGWQGYMSGVRNYSYEVHSNVGTRADDAIVEGVQAYLRSLTVPPPANSKTRLDGSLSAEAILGKAIFKGEGGCASCHAGPVGTNGRVIPVSSTPDAADVPSLVGAYRHGIWLKHGEAPTLRAAVDNMADFFGSDLDETKRQLVTRYLEELTGREFFLMSSNPATLSAERSAVETPRVALDVETEFELIFSLPVLDTPENLSKIEIVGGDGALKRTKVTVAGPRRVLVSIAEETPGEASLLSYGSTYAITIRPDFESFSEKPLTGPMLIPFETASVPTLRMEGDYTLRLWAPRLVFNPQGNYFDKEQSRPVDVSLVASPTPAGASLLLNLEQGLSFPVNAVISGQSLYIPPTPVPAGPRSFVDGFSGYYDASFDDRDGDGVGDFAEGLYSYTGPGFRIEGLRWELVRAGSEE